MDEESTKDETGETMSRAVRPHSASRRKRGRAGVARASGKERAEVTSPLDPEAGEPVADSPLGEPELRVLPGGRDETEGEAFPGPPDIGAALRRARKRRGVSLERAAEETRLPVRALAALEGSGSEEDLPDPPYDRYFLREYAGYLGLTAGPLAEMLERRHEPEPEMTLDLLPAEPAPRRWPVWMLAALSIGVLLTLAGLRLSSFRSAPAASPALPDQPATQAPRPTVSPPVQASPEAPRVRGVAAVVRLSAPCWIQATADGKVTMSETLPAGETLRLKAKRTLDLVLGNGGAVRLEVNGKRVPTGGTGEVVRLSFTWEHGRVTRS